MELDDKIINAHWTKDNKGKPQFFIINEAIISKLCILGEENEPCFEGASITDEDENFKLEFSFDDGFKQQLFSMMEEMKNILSKGGASVMNTYAVEIGDTLWSQIYDYLDNNYSGGNENECRCPEYRIKGIYEEDTAKFVILQHRSSGKCYQLNFELSEENGFVPVGEMFEVTQTFVPLAEPQFALETVEEFETTRYTVTEPVVDETPAEEPVEEPVSAPQVSYILEEIPEYVELLKKYNELENSYNELNATIEPLNEKIAVLSTFKQNIDRQEKQNMINSFYMLSDEDKQDVIDNIDNYSLDEIEAKLSVICVRNKVNFSLEENNNSDPMVYNLNDDGDDLSVPAWLKAVQAVAEKM